MSCTSLSCASGVVEDYESGPHACTDGAQACGSYRGERARPSFRTRGAAVCGPFALAAVALTVPAVLGLMHMLRERQWVAGTVGGALGLLAVTGTIAINLVAWEMMRFGIPIPATVAVLHDAKHTAAEFHGFRPTSPPPAGA
jgi:hypothetical protein